MKTTLYYKHQTSLFHNRMVVYVLCVCPRLNDPTKCPGNGSSRGDCDCRKDYTAAGLTTFSKVRLDIGTMNIISELPIAMF